MCNETTTLLPPAKPSNRLTSPSPASLHTRAVVLKGATMKTMKDLTGKKFNRWLVIGLSHKANNRNYWKCRCDCGTEKVVLREGLTRNLSKSCGCLRDEVTSNASITHGACVGGKLIAEYSIWRGIKRRCYMPNDESFTDYGGRGIKMCDRWLNSFPKFLNDMGICPVGFTI